MQQHRGWMPWLNAKAWAARAARVRAALALMDDDRNGYGSEAPLFDEDLRKKIEVVEDHDAPQEREETRAEEEQTDQYRAPQNTGDSSSAGVEQGGTGSTGPSSMAGLVVPRVGHEGCLLPSLGVGRCFFLFEILRSGSESAESTNFVADSSRRRTHGMPGCLCRRGSRTLLHVCFPQFFCFRSKAAFVLWRHGGFCLSWWLDSVMCGATLWGSMDSAALAGPSVRVASVSRIGGFWSYCKSHGIHTCSCSVWLC